MMQGVELYHHALSYSRPLESEDDAREGFTLPGECGLTLLLNGFFCSLAMCMLASYSISVSIYRRCVREKLASETCKSGLFS